MTNKSASPKTAALFLSLYRRGKSAANSKLADSLVPFSHFMVIVLAQLCGKFRCLLVV